MSRALAVLLLWLLRGRCPDAAPRERPARDLWSMSTAALQAALDGRKVM